MREGRHRVIKKKIMSKRSQSLPLQVSFVGRVAFSVGSQGLDLSMKTNEGLGPYASTQLKNS